MADWDARAKDVQSLKGQQSDSFFNRNEELNMLLDWLGKTPREIGVLLGPSDSGKTSLLRRIEELWTSNGDLAVQSPIFYVDMRKQSWKTPGDAAASLAEFVCTWAERWQKWVKAAAKVVSLHLGNSVASVNVDGDSMVAAFLGGLDGKKSDLAHVLMRFSKIVADNAWLYPIFILDEVDRLKLWPKADVNMLIGCMKALTKQDQRAYAILSTSDEFFRQWLKCMFTPGQWRGFGLGFFNEFSAREFFKSQCAHADFTDEEWNHIYGACGGAPLLLYHCAEVAYSLQLSWKEAAEGCVEECLDHVMRGMQANVNDDGFEGKRFRAIAESINDKGFIGVKEVCKCIYSGSEDVCRKELEKMLQGNFIHIRYTPKTIRYEDIASQDVGKETELVTARSPVERGAMKVILKG